MNLKKRLQFRADRVKALTAPIFIESLAVPLRRAASYRFNNHQVCLNPDRYNIYLPPNLHAEAFIVLAFHKGKWWMCSNAELKAFSSTGGAAGYGGYSVPFNSRFDALNQGLAEIAKFFKQHSDNECSGKIWQQRAKAALAIVLSVNLQTWSCKTGTV